MKVMLLSIKPKWLCKILNGEKIREVRKFLPYDYQGPVVVYCSKASNTSDYLVYNPNDKKFELVSKDLVLDDELNGKVVAIFNCDEVTAYQCEFWEEPLWGKESCYQGISELPDYPDEDGDSYDINTDNQYYSEEDLRNYSRFINETCLTLEELKKYLGIGDRTFFSMKISNVRVFKNPKELTQLHSYDMCTSQPAKLSLHNPPQNYCYVYYDVSLQWEACTHAIA